MIGPCTKGPHKTGIGPRIAWDSDPLNGANPRSNETSPGPKEHLDPTMSKEALFSEAQLGLVGSHLTKVNWASSDESPARIGLWPPSRIRTVRTWSSDHLLYERHRSYANSLTIFMRTG